MKTCVLILSAPRSGSSCLSGCVHLCGVSLGKDVTQVKDRYNEKGYFENSKLLSLHHTILTESNINMFGIFGFGPQTPKQIDSFEFQKKLVAVFQEQFDGDDLFAIKDPRILFMRPTYLRALSEYQAEPKVLDLRRKRESCMASIKKGPWNVGPLEKICDKYAELLDEFNVTPVLQVDFEELIDNPRDVMQSVCKFIGTRYNPEVESFVEKRLVHQC